MKMQTWNRVWFIGMAIVAFIACGYTLVYGEDEQPPAQQAPEPATQEQEEDPELDLFFLWVRERNVAAYKELAQLRAEVAETKTDIDKAHEQMRRYQDVSKATADILIQLPKLDTFLTDMRRENQITVAQQTSLRVWHLGITESYTDFRLQVLGRHTADITRRLGIEERYVDVSPDAPLEITLPELPERRQFVISRVASSIYDAFAKLQKELANLILQYNTKLEEEKKKKDEPSEQEEEEEAPK